MAVHIQNMNVRPVNKPAREANEFIFMPVFKISILFTSHDGT